MSDFRNFFRDIGKPSKRRSHGVEDGPELIVVVMGSTGTGKSSLINAMTGKKSVKVSDKLASETTEIKVTDWTFDRRRVKLVDTPGFDDTFLSDTDVLLMIADFLQGRFGRRVYVNGIIYLHRIIDPRMTGTAMKNLQLLQDLCGNESLKNVLLVTTFWEHVPSEVGKRREKELANDFWKPLVDLGSRIHRYRFKSPGLDLMEDIMNHQSTIIELQLQMELSGAGLSLLNTTVGRRVQAGLNHQLEQLGMTLNHVQEEQRALQARRNASARANEMARLTAHESRVMAEIATVQRDLSSLQTPRDYATRAVDNKIAEIAAEKGIDEMEAFWDFYGAFEDEDDSEGDKRRDSFGLYGGQPVSPGYKSSGYGNQQLGREINANRYSQQTVPSRNVLEYTNEASDREVDVGGYDTEEQMSAGYSPGGYGGQQIGSGYNAETYDDQEIDSGGGYSRYGGHKLGRGNDSGGYSNTYNAGRYGEQQWRDSRGY